VYDSLGDYAKARELYERALAIFEKHLGQNHPNVATLVNNLGEVYISLGDYAKARELCERALAIFEKHLGQNHPNVAMLVNNLGSVYKSLGDYAKARELFERALAIDEKHFGKDHPNVAIDVNNLGFVYDSLGNYAKARELYERALAIKEQFRQPEGLWIAYYRVSVVLDETGRPAPAIFFGKNAVNTIQTLRTAISAMEQSLQKSFLEDKDHVYRHLADLLIDQGRLPEAQQVLAMLKEEEYFDFIRRDAESKDVRQTRAAYTPIETPWAERYGQVNARLAALGREYGELREKQRQTGLTQSEKTRVAALRNDLKTGRKAFRAFLAELTAELGKVGAERAAEIGEKQLGRLRALQGTLRQLGGRAVTLHYLATDDKLRIILTTPDAQLVRDADISSADLNQKIHQFRTVLQNPQANPLPLAQELYDVVLGPAAGDLKGAGAQTLMVSLDGALRYLPVAALHDGEQYAAQTWRIVVFTEAAKTRLTTPSAPDWRLAGMGLSREIPGFSPLPAVPDELEGIVRRGPDDEDGVLPGVVFLDEDFSEDRMIDALFDGYPVLHVASHFVFRPGNETNSFLLMGDGGELSLARLKDPDFDFIDVELLALSACETAMGGGKGADGREIEGFGALAQNQGAKAVLATLWPVADNSTGQFMRNFYRLRQEENLSKAEALRRAQVGFITGSAGRPPAAPAADKRAKIIHTKPDNAPADGFVPDSAAPFAHPYYWGPFILMGHWL